MDESILKEIYQKGKSEKENYVCVCDIVFEKRGDFIVPLGELYKNHHYSINENLCVVLKYKGRNLKIISNQVVPVEPAVDIEAYLKGAIPKRKIENFFSRS